MLLTVLWFRQVIRPESRRGSEALPDGHFITSFKPLLNTLHNLFVALVNMDIFQITLKISFFNLVFRGEPNSVRFGNIV